jgi:hypothetical protein
MVRHHSCFRFRVLVLSALGSVQPILLTATDPRISPVYTLMRCRHSSLAHDTATTTRIGHTNQGHKNLDTFPSIPLLRSVSSTIPPGFLPRFARLGGACLRIFTRKTQIE